MSAVDAIESGHHDDHHEHARFIAHHFDSAEQQYDSGKLGIWLFLTTEILFFSGLFCAYTLYRAHHPELFVEASTHLDKILGGFNTVVLLFSSLTMALAVRSAQLAENKKVVIYLAITMVCAAMFLGVKAVEYSHKWDEGIWTRGYYNLHHTNVEGISSYLIYISIPFVVLLVGSVIAAIIFRVRNNSVLFGFFLILAIMFGGYFLGAVAGQVYMGMKPTAEADTHVAAVVGDDEHDQGDGSQSHDEAEHATGAETTLPAGEVVHEPTSREVGVFFSIYYCMTGLHAFHVIGGMAALSWLLYRSLNAHWRSDYFGPVDYVGLYWHIVDLIWIFLFPLLYLIN